MKCFFLLYPETNATQDGYRYGASHRYVKAYVPFGWLENNGWD